MENDRDKEHFGTPKRVAAEAQDPRKARKSPAGGNTPKAYFYNSGEQIKKGDRVIWKKTRQVVKSGSAGDTEDPSVKLENDKSAKSSLLTFVGRKLPEVEAAPAVENDLNRGTIFDVERRGANSNNSNNNSNNDPAPVVSQAEIARMLDTMEHMTAQLKQMALAQKK
jgi:hypothetical protein